jgi:hypothetical protein
MSPVGHSRRFRRVHAMSGYPPTLTVRADVADSTDAAAPGSGGTCSPCRAAGRLYWARRLARRVTASACRTIVALLSPRASHTRMACFAIQPKEGRYR